MRSIVSFILIASFLTSGGLGAGAPVILCTESDGTVHLENPLHRCCDANECQEREHKPSVAAAFAHRAIAIIALEECGSCFDVLLVNSIQHDAAIPAVKADGAARFEMVTPPSAITAPGADIDPGLTILRFLSAISGGAAHASIDTVVLRC